MKNTTFNRILRLDPRYSLPQQKPGPNLKNNNLVKICIAMFGGTMLPFAFAPYDHAWLAWPALICLLYSIDHNFAKRSFVNGGLFALCYFGIGVHWLTHSIHVFGHAPLIVAIFVTALLVIILALFIATLGWLLAKYQVATPFKCLGFATGWTLFEVLRSILFTGFPWLLLGYSQTNTLLAGFAPLIGVYGISFIVCLSSACLFYFIRTQHYRITIFLILVALGLCTLLSTWMSNHHPAYYPVQAPIPVTLVQGSVSQDIKWSPQHSTEIVKQYEALSNKHWQNRIVIWPEAAIPLAMQSIEPWLNQLAEKARAQQSTLITGIPIFNEQKQAFYNSLIALGEYEGRYDKYHLVPFGEYTPLHLLFSWFMRWFNIPMSDLLPGNRQQALLNIKHLHIAPFICYEIAFSSQVFATLPQANLALVISDDSWFGHSSAAAQHMQIASMRALEMGRSVLFVSNGGISGVISPRGTLQALAPPYQSAVIETSVQAYAGQTPLINLGQWVWFWTLLLCALVCFLVALRKYSTHLRFEVVV